MFFQIFVVQIGDVFALFLRGGVFFAQAAVGFELFAAAFQIVGEAAQQAGFGGGLDFGGGVVGKGGRRGEGEEQEREQRAGFFRKHGHRAGDLFFQTASAVTTECVASHGTCAPPLGGTLCLGRKAV